MYYPRSTFNNRHQKIRVSRDSIFNLLKWAVRFAFAIPQPAFTFHQTLTFPIEHQDTKAAKAIFNKFLKALFKKYGKYDLASFYVIETSKSNGIHFHVCFSFFNVEKLPFVQSRMEKDFRSDLFKRWNALNGDGCVHDANRLKSVIFNLKTIEYFVKSLRIPIKTESRPETIRWGIGGKRTLLLYTETASKDLLNQTFDKLFKDGGRKNKKSVSVMDREQNNPLVVGNGMIQNNRNMLGSFFQTGDSRIKSDLICDNEHIDTVSVV